MIIFALTLSLSLPVIAEEKNQIALEQQWDMGFFVATCPGIALPESLPVQTSPEVDITADQYNTPADGVVLFEGNVILQHGEKSLSADTAQLDKIKDTFRAQGNVRYQDPQIRLISEAIQLDFEQQSGEFSAPKFQLSRSSLRGAATRIDLQTDRKITITDTGLTSCPPGEEAWLLQSSKIEIDPDSGSGVAEDVVLRINGIPFFYLPTISFPTDDRRKSGLLYPSVGSSKRNGLEFQVPWYWNISPDKDATFSARYLSKRGLMLGAEYRQVTQNSENKIYAEYLDNDNKGLPGKENRFFFQLNNDYSKGEHLRGTVDISSVSDDDYFYDFGGNYSSGNRNYLRRFAQLSYDNEHLSFTGIFSNDQLLSTSEDPYSRLPQLRLSFLYPESIAGLTTNLHLEATAFRIQSGVEAERMNVIPEISLPMHWLSGYIKPLLKLHYSQYSQDDPDNIFAKNVSRSVPIFSVDSGMVFERQLDIKQTNFIQTLEPRLFYLYVPDKQQNGIALFDTTSVNNGVNSLFRENRYSGYDRIGDSNQVSLAITSRFYEQESGRERMRLTMGRAYYLDDRKVNLAISQPGIQAIDLGVDDRANSALITNLHLELYDNWWLKGELEYDETERGTEKGVLGLQYRTRNLVFNLRHRLNRYNAIDDIEQAEVSFSWQSSSELSFVGRWQRDIRKNRTIDSFAGLEYESCCWAVRLVARRYLNIRLDQQGVSVPGADEFNTGIYLEFVLKGLTNIGNGLKLERDIQGYEDRFKDY